jgi:myo-inositol-1(or 4)-monophosphatase
MTGAARKAARRLARDFSEVEQLQVSMKGPADFVSEADRQAELILYEELSKARPGYGFLMEESGERAGTDKSHRWIVDPLDGTLNFLHGFPQFAISIALERDGHLVAGVIFDIVQNELFVAERGQGAWLNDRRLRVSARKDMNTMLIATGMPFLGKEGHDRYLKELSAVMPTVAGIRRMGAAALDLAYVAAGRFDAFWERNLQQWDIAAGILLVQEAGGYVSDLDSRADPLKTGNILTGNDAAHRELTKLFAKIR